MDSFIIKGPAQLKGDISISGSKNAALPIMTACLSKPGIYTLNNVPNLRDTRTMIKLLEIIALTDPFPLEPFSQTNYAVLQAFSETSRFANTSELVR